MTEREAQLRKAARAEDLHQGIAAGPPIPAYMKEPLTRYVVDRRVVGRFLTAVLKNDLQEACAYADDENLAALRTWCQLIYNYTPRDCHGSPAKVSAWLAGSERDDP